MSDDQHELRQLVDDMLAGVDPRADVHDGFDRTIWDRLHEAGLTTLLVPETHGGSGATFHEVATVLRGAGYHGATVPIAETSLAGAILAQCGVSPPAGVIGVAFTFPREAAEQTVFDPVPYGRAADHLVVVERDGEQATVRLAPTADADITRGSNLANEPADRVTFEQPPQKVGVLDSYRRLRVDAAACRALLQAGALARIHDLTLAYASEREQFGRAVVRFQAVQHMVVATYGASTIARAITDEMVSALADDSVDPARRDSLVAAARTVCGQSAATAARWAHQVHGAMGFTVEHPLHAFTTRVRAWRDQDGTDVEWSRRLGARLRDRDTDLWHQITDTVGHEV